MQPAVFLDRDGVLVRDVDYLRSEEDIQILDGVPAVLAALARAGFCLIVITNQPVVARGLLSEEAVVRLHDTVLQRLSPDGPSPVRATYFCFHHPNADIPQYRCDCECRKPRPGLILKAQREYQIDMTRSFLIGDRMTDIVAGAKAGLTTILVKTGAHSAAPIETQEPIDATLRPDRECADLREACAWILAERPL